MRTSPTQSPSAEVIPTSPRTRCDKCNEKMDVFELIIAKVDGKLQCLQLCGFCASMLREEMRSKVPAQQVTVSEDGTTTVTKKKRVRCSSGMSSRPDYLLDINLKEETIEDLRKLRHHLYARKSNAKDETIKKELAKKIDDLRAELVRRKAYYGKEGITGGKWKKQVANKRK